MASLFRRKEKKLPLPKQQENAIGEVAMPRAPEQPESFPIEHSSSQIEQQQPQEKQFDQKIAEQVPLPGGSQQQVQQSTNQPIVEPVAQKSVIRKDIEGVLSDGLSQVYQGMTPKEQEIFRLKGDEAASKIEEMMLGFTATAKKVVAIIRAWLAFIPRANKYFLEQESKVKTDEILKLQKKKKKEARARIDMN